MNALYQKKFKNVIRSYHMVAEGDVIIAGVSGGADSVLMLWFLKKLLQEICFELRVVHVNHMLRGKEACRDAEFVQHLCETLEIPCRTAEYPVEELSAAWKLGTEETGRIVRKQAFEEEAARIEKAGERIRIALAHNQDDLAETILHNMARGSGLKGMSSMRPVSGRIIRPMIGMEKKEIQEYLERHDLAYITDSSNASDDYTRNRIRHHILPLLQQEINSRAAENIARTAEISAEAIDYIEAEAEKLLQKCGGKEKEMLFGPEFWEAPAALKHTALLMAMKKLSGEQKDLSSEHVRLIENLNGRQVGKRTDLPYGLEACRGYQGVVLKRKSQKMASPPVKKLNLNGTTDFGKYEFMTRIFDYKGENIVEKKCTKWFDYDRIKGTLIIRCRKSEDNLVIDSAGRRKKVNRILIDQKIPAETRDSLPVIEAENEILWIAGVRMTEAYRITETTKKILEIKYTGGNEDE